MKLTIAACLLQALPAFSIPSSPPSYGQGARANCVVESAGTNDSASAILRAFHECGHNHGFERGRIVFKNETYHVKSVMNTTGLRNVDIDLHGTLLWDTNINYWLNHSLPVGYQNQSSAWLFGGESVNWNGFGYGTFDGVSLSCPVPRHERLLTGIGNGQVWYDFINGTNNYPGRPHSITITGTKDSYFEGIRFVQSQMVCSR